MQAIVYTAYGPPDVLQLKDVEKPAPADNEVLIKIHATTVEAADASFRRGNTPSARLFSGLLKPRFAIPSSEFGGEIEALDNGVTRFKHGDRVVGTGGPTFGANAEYICLPEDGPMARKPDSLTYAEAVAIHPGALTALPNLRDAAHLQRGQTVLINGASGSIGASAVQLAEHFMAHARHPCHAREP